MKVLACTPEEFQHLKSLQVQRRWDWPAIFSTNGWIVWPRTTNGYTPPEDREDVRGLNPVIDQVADLYVNTVRSSGGRIFIGDFFACYADKRTGEKIPFVIFVKSPSGDILQIRGPESR